MIAYAKIKIEKIEIHAGIPLVSQALSLPRGICGGMRIAHVGNAERGFDGNHRQYVEYNAG